MFIIKSEEGYWNNEMGWVYSSKQATMFDTDEYDLPIGKDVHWEKRSVKNDKRIHGGRNRY